MNSRNFFAELKRRNVYKVAVAYAVVGWLVMQVAATIVPALHLPESLTTAVVVVTLLGFPVALVIAWAFEMTPEGMKRTENVSPTETIPQWSRRKFVTFIAIVASVAAALLAYQFGRPRAVPVAIAAAPAKPIPEKSIAILPFANLSGDPNNAYFAAGIQDEIITRLSKIADLQVISCLSTQRFKGAPDDIPAIAAQLGVANVLEGSVQRATDQVRVNVQLVKGATDTHLWADTFDRKLTDIFAVESEIAKSVAGTLQARLTALEQDAIAAQPTENTEAYQLYLKGRFFWNKRTAENLRKAADYFNQAVAADPKYALAYVGLADAYVLMPLYGAGSPLECYPKAKEAVRKALKLDDTLAEAHTSMAQVLCYYDLDPEKAAKEFQRAVELNPNYATGHHWYGSSGLVALGRFDDAIAQVKRALELDPLSLVINTDLGSTYYRARRNDEAIEQLRKTLEMDPNFYYARWNLGSALAIKGDLRHAIEEYLKARQLNDNPSILGLLGYAYASSGNKAQALAIQTQVEGLSKQRYVSPYCFALISLGLGDKEAAIRWLEKGYQERAGESLRYLKVDPLLDRLRGDARFEALVQKVVGPPVGAAP